MKSVRSMSAWSSLCLVLSLIHSSPLWADGAERGNGGLTEGQWYADHVILPVNYYVGLCNDSRGEGVVRFRLKGATCAELRTLQATARHAGVNFKRKVYGYDNRERDSINNGVDLVTVGEIKWKEAKKKALAMRIRSPIHEFATLAKLESSDSYGWSAPVVRAIVEDPDVQPTLDPIRYSKEYLLSLEDIDLLRLVLQWSEGVAEKRKRADALFGGCLIKVHKSEAEKIEFPEVYFYDRPAGAGTFRWREEIFGVYIGQNLIKEHRSDRVVWSDDLFNPGKDEIQVSYSRFLAARHFKKLVKDGKCGAI